MSHFFMQLPCLKEVQGNRDDQTIYQNRTGGCLTPTTIKVGAVVFGLLLIGAGVAMYFLHVNALAAYITGGVGGAVIIGVAIWSIIGCCLRGKNVGMREFTLELTLSQAATITEEEVATILKDNPNLNQLRVDCRSHRMDTNGDRDFKALDAHFTQNIGKSSDAWYIYDRK